MLSPSRVTKETASKAAKSTTRLNADVEPLGLEEAPTSDLNTPTYSLADIALFAQGADGDQQPEQQRARRSQIRRRSAGLPTAPPSVYEALHSPSRPLEADDLRFFEFRFGQSFGNVRVHTGPKGAASARSLSSLAYTVGDHIVFGSGQYSPRTRHGRKLLAHELSHVRQQHRARPAGELLEIGDAFDTLEHEAEAAETRAASVTYLSTQRVQRVSLWQKIIRFFGVEGDFGDKELFDYLRYLDTYHHIEDNYDSDNKARAVVKRWQAGKAGYALFAPQKVLLIKEMLSGVVSGADEIGILGIIAGSDDGDLYRIFQQVKPEDLQRNIGGDIGKKLELLILEYKRRNADPMTGTAAVSETQHLLTESVLSPGSKLVDEPPKPDPDKDKDKKDKEDEKKPPPPPPKFEDAPKMTGVADHAFEKGMVVAIKDFVQKKAAQFQANKKAGFVLSGDIARDLGKVAQKHTEEYFAPYLEVATREPSEPYHPGKYDVTKEIHSQAEVPITVEGTADHPGRLQWMRYWMAHQGEGVLKTYNCDTTRSPDKEEFERVAGIIARDASLGSNIDDTIHGWPAEATGGINLDLQRDTSTEEKKRWERWDIYTTILHEMMHKLQHPNYKRTHELFTGTAQEILKEGMADVMRRDLWDGPGQLKKKLSTPAYDSTREQIEGGKYDYREEIVNYHKDYDERAEALKIVNGDDKRKGVGMPNARAAFFLGHTDLLGIGEGTRGARSSLVGIANYRATDEKEAQIVVAKVGDTLETIRTRTGAGENGVLNEMTDKPLKPGDAINGGMRLKIPGIRYVYAIRGDTLKAVAAQNLVELEALAAANDLKPEPDHKFPPGARILIPIHRELP